MRAFAAFVIVSLFLLVGCGDALDETTPNNSAACKAYLNAADAKAAEEAKPGTSEHGQLYSGFAESGRFTFEGKTWLEPDEGCADA